MNNITSMYTSRTNFYLSKEFGRPATWGWLTCLCSKFAFYWGWFHITHVPTKKKIMLSRKSLPLTLWGGLLAYHVLSNPSLTSPKNTTTSSCVCPTVRNDTRTSWKSPFVVRADQINLLYFDLLFFVQLSIWTSKEGDKPVGGIISGSGNGSAPKQFFTPTTSASCKGSSMEEIGMCRLE